MALRSQSGSHRGTSRRCHISPRCRWRTVFRGVPAVQSVFGLRPIPSEHERNWFATVAEGHQDGIATMEGGGEVAAEGGIVVEHHDITLT